MASLKDFERFSRWAAGSEEFYAFKTPYVRLIFDP